LFPAVWDDFVPGDPECRVIDGFAEMLVMADLGFERAHAAETRRAGMAFLGHSNRTLGIVSPILIVRDFFGLTPKMETAQNLAS
jgi:hypothetical protein